MSKWKRLLWIARLVVEYHLWERIHWSQSRVPIWCPYRELWILPLIYLGEEILRSSKNKTLSAPWPCFQLYLLSDEAGANIEAVYWSCQLACTRKMKPCQESLINASKLIFWGLLITYGVSLLVKQNSFFSSRRTKKPSSSVRPSNF